MFTIAAISKKSEEKKKLLLRLLKKYRMKIWKLNKCNQRAQTDGFAEQNGRDAERADLTCRY